MDQEYEILKINTGKKDIKSDKGQVDDKTKQGKQISNRLVQKFCFKLPMNKKDFLLANFFFFLPCHLPKDPGNPFCTVE